MPQQTFDFRNSHIEKQIIKSSSEAEPRIPEESKDERIQFRIEPNRKDSVMEFCFEKNITKTDLAREGMYFYMDHYLYKDKLRDHWKTVKAMLDTLP